MSTLPAWEFQGRDAELALLRGELERVADGAEAVVVVEGRAGMGKSRLLAEVAAIARRLGIRIGVSAADPSDTVVELAALLAALFDGAEPLLDPGSLSTLHAQPEQRFWLLARHMQGMTLVRPRPRRGQMPWRCARADRLGAAQARITGVAAASARSAVPPSRGLAEVREILGRVLAAHRQGVLDRARQQYLTPLSGDRESWYDAAVEFLEQAGTQRDPH